MVNFLDVINGKFVDAAKPDEKYIEERKAGLETSKREFEEIEAQIERGKIALGIINEETGPHYSREFYDKNGFFYTKEQVIKAGA